MTQAPVPLDPSFQLRLPAFEGPLDLLLHLIQKHELEILDLPVAFVTERYLEYIGVMERLNLDIAAEYLVMASTLAFIKSKMLLPPDPTAVADDDTPEEEIDPRAELIRRLLEYQKYKGAAADLAARGMAGSDVFMRGMEAPEALGDPPLAGFGLFKLLDAFAAVLARTKTGSQFAITNELMSINDRMLQLVERLKGQIRCRFEELFDDATTPADVVVTFLAILELAKRRLARIYQSEPIAPIHLEYRVLEEDAEKAALQQAVTSDGGSPHAEPVNEHEDAAIARPGEDPLGEVIEPGSEPASAHEDAAIARPGEDASGEVIDHGSERADEDAAIAQPGEDPLSEVIEHPSADEDAAQPGEDPLGEVVASAHEDASVAQPDGDVYGETDRTSGLEEAVVAAPHEDPLGDVLEPTDPHEDAAIAQPGEDALGEVLEPGSEGSNTLDSEDDVAHDAAPSEAESPARNEDE